MFSGACTAKEFSGSTDKGTYGLSNIVFMVLQETRKHHTTQPCTPGSILFTAAIEPSPKIFQSKLCADPPVGQGIRTVFSNTWRVRRTVVATTGYTAFCIHLYTGRRTHHAPVEPICQGREQRLRLVLDDMRPRDRKVHHGENVAQQDHNA
jgi:hypothetical protein